MILPFLALPALAGGRTGEFDYYLLALSWSPAWCAAEGRARGDAQCAPDGPSGFVVHGLWPQYEEGWPSFCHTPERDPSRSETAAMAPVMGSAGNAWHQWQKHGSCSGLAAEDFYALVHDALEAIRLPALQPGAGAEPEAIAGRFLEQNPGLAPDGLAVTCRDGMIREVRLCLTRDLHPRACGADVLADACRLSRADLP